MPRVSIITSMYNRQPEVLEVIEKLFFPSLLNNGRMDAEVIIIDDCSPLEEETRLMVENFLPALQEKFEKVVFVRNLSNLGFAESFNKGIFMAMGERLLIVNDDLYFPQGSITELVKTLDEGHLIAGPITNTSSSWSFQYCRQAPLIKAYTDEETERLEAFARWLKNKMEGKRITTDNLCGFCFVVDAKLMKKIGGFDESYKYGLFEDTAMIQLIARDYGREKIAINLEVFVGHGGTKGTSRTVMQQPFKMARALLVNGFKYGYSWGFLKLLKRIVFGYWSMYNGKGTISELFPKAVDY